MLKIRVKRQSAIFSYRKHKSTIVRLVGLGFLVIFLASCSNGEPKPGVITSGDAGQASATVVSTATSLPPTPTPVPMAAQVNGEGISLAEYWAELARYKASTGHELTTDDEQRVLGDLIDQILLAQGAAEQDYLVDELTLNERLAQLTTQMGGEQALLDWLSTNSYDEASFQQALRRATASAWMRDEILRTTPTTAEQVHAQQILFDNPDEANQILAQLQGGADFAQLAAQYDPATRGELGWFPRGYLLDPALEEAVFKLEVGQHTPVLQSAIGYHIIQVVEREMDRSLSPDALLMMQTQAVKDWLETQRGKSEIEILVK